MDKDNSTQTLYSFIYAYEMAKHEHNAKRIRLTIRYFFIIPMILLTFMFFTGSSNIVFLMLWIVSLFSIAAYAIVIEYNDYELQKRMHIMEQLKDGDNVIELDASNMLPILNRKEFQAFGIDKASAGMAISAYNRQKRKARSALPPPEEAVLDAVSTENAAQDAASTESAVADIAGSDNAETEKTGTKKPRKRKTKAKSAAVQETSQETAPDADNTESAVVEKLSTENSVPDNGSVKKPRKRRTKAKSASAEDAKQDPPQTVTASDTAPEGGHEQ